MSICEDCICRKYCGDDDIRKCDRYFRDGGIKKEQTNEEWFCSLQTEEKAKFIADNDGTIQIGDEVDYQNTMTKWVEWLKQPHTPFS
jgi:hypothetical protein